MDWFVWLIMGWGICFSTRFPQRNKKEGQRGHMMENSVESVEFCKRKKTWKWESENQEKERHDTPNHDHYLRWHQENWLSQATVEWSKDMPPSLTYVFRVMCVQKINVYMHVYD